ncbi:Serine protease [Flavobacterium sp. 9AF]|nr:Serine protease [Flavobacterium sp. 9AF]
MFSLVNAQNQEKKQIDEKKMQMILDKKIFESNINQIKVDETHIKVLSNEAKLLHNDAEFIVKENLLQQIDQQLGNIESKTEAQNNSKTTQQDSKPIDSLLISAVEKNYATNLENSNTTVRLSGPSQFDSRIELLQLNPNSDWQFQLLTKSESVAMLIEKENLTQFAQDTYLLDTSKTLGKLYNLCSDQAFYNQPVSGIGTAFIISKTSMITANHVFERDIKDYIVVFGYKILVAKTGATDYYFNAKDIYFPKTILRKNLDLDLVEFTVDREFDKVALEWENSSVAVAKESEVYMIGHPTGLPLKVALNAFIEENTNPFYFYTSLDSFQGNSGSPVFNFYTHKVIGVLVSGEVDYIYNGNCYYSPVCKIPYCKGEKVMRIERFLE